MVGARRNHIIRLGVFESKRLPLKEVFLLSISFCGFVVLTNLSLQLNSVGFYQVLRVCAHELRFLIDVLQVAKTLTTPAIMLIQSNFYGKVFDTPILYSLAVIIVGGK